MICCTALTLVDCIRNVIKVYCLWKLCEYFAGHFTRNFLTNYSMGFVRNPRKIFLGQTNADGCDSDMPNHLLMMASSIKSIVLL